MKTKLFIFTTALAIAASHIPAATNDHAEIKAEITKRHDEAVKRLQDWIGFPSIAAENRNYPEGAETMAKLDEISAIERQRGRVWRGCAVEIVTSTHAYPVASRRSCR